jgi:hypothetical protein
MSSVSLSHRITGRLRRLHLVFKFLLLLSGGALFFLLFPFLLRFGMPVYAILFILLLCFGVLFRIVIGRRTFRITMLLWAGGCVIYLCIAGVLILRSVQPLPYLEMGRAQLVLYYLSYPFRVLGIFFTGLIFAGITSPADFLHWGEVGLRIALMYRAFEYAVISLGDVRRALVLQGEWPEPRRVQGAGRRIGLFFRGAPVMVTMIFRNIILWFPWAWICYAKLKRELEKGGAL